MNPAPRSTHVGDSKKLPFHDSGPDFLPFPHGGLEHLGFPFQGYLAKGP